MKKKTVSYVVDLSNLPPLTEDQRRRFDRLKAMPDSEIDFSEIPMLTDEFFKNAIRNPYVRPTKTSTTVRIDSDVLAWLRTQGRGYQSRINAILRKEMLESLK